MKATILDLLIDIMDVIISEKQYHSSNHSMLIKVLKRAGVMHAEMRSTLKWLDNTMQISTTIWEKKIKPESQYYGERIYSPSENNKISPKGKSFLYSLINRGVIDIIIHEKIIDSVMACDTEINLQQLRWIACMVRASHVGHNSDIGLVDMTLDYDDDPAIMKH